MPAIIAQDDLESGGSSGGTGWLFGWFLSGDSSVTSTGTPHAGTRHLRLRRANGYADRAVNLSGQTNVTLKFWAKADSFEGSEYVEVRVSPDGVNWTVLRSWQNGDDDNTYRLYQFNLSALGLSMTSQFWIAIDAEMGDTSDRFYIDDIQFVSG